MLDRIGHPEVSSDWNVVGQILPFWVVWFFFLMTVKQCFCMGRLWLLKQLQQPGNWCKAWSIREPESPFSRGNILPASVLHSLVIMILNLKCKFLKVLLFSCAFFFNFIFYFTLLDQYLLLALLDMIASFLMKCFYYWIFSESQTVACVALRTGKKAAWGVFVGLYCDAVLMVLILN